MVGLRSAFRLLVLMIFVSWVEGDSEVFLSCTDLGGECVSIEDTSCPFKLDLPGCDEDQTCCSPKRHRDAYVVPVGPIVPIVVNPAPIDTTIQPAFISCMSAVNGSCQSECNNYRIQVEGNCTDGNKCCGCKPSCECLESYGFGMRKSPNVTCDGQTDDTLCEGPECTCCIPDCPVSHDCLSAGGRCAASCSDVEESHPTIECNKGNNAACQCCVPKTCKQGFWCTISGGKCRATCDQKTEYAASYRTCTNGCACCKRRLSLPQVKPWG